MIKKFKIEHEPTCGEIEVEIDFGVKINDFSVKELIKAVVDFWTGSKERLSDNDDDYLITFLKRLCEEVMRISADKNLNTQEIIEEFKYLEGWMLIDGSYGIKLKSFIEPDFKYQNDYIITEL